MMDFDKVLELSGKMLSEDQRRVVFSDCATIVSAGAGSGKTTVLSLRFLRLVNDGVDADRILTITFTKKAAAEMYGRIHSLLSSMAKSDEDYAFQLKEKFPNASISTMDSFWTEVARAGCLKYGISKDFSLEDADTRLRLARKVYTTLSTALSSEESICDIVSNSEIVEGLNIINSSFEPSKIEDILSKITLNTNILTKLPAETGRRFYEPLFLSFFDIYDPIGRIYAIFGEMSELAGEVSAKCSKSIFRNGEFDKAREAICSSGYESFDGPLSTESIHELLSKIDLSLLPEFKVGNAKQADDKDKNETIKKVCLPAYREALANLRALKQMEANLPLQESIDNVLRAFVYLYNKEKRAKAILSFADVQEIAKKVLLSDRSIRDYYKSRFDYIMVDEFQDNNLDQRNLLYLLSERCDLHSEEIPEAECLDKKKLFLVGDDKQSIYRFRGADVSVFNALKSEIVDKMGGLALTLGENYRSEPQLVNHFNDIFSYVFETEETEPDKNESLVNSFRGIEEGDYHAEAKGINAGRSEGQVTPVIELAVIPYVKKSKEEKALYLSERESEAVYIAAKVLDILNDEDYWIPGKDGKLRKPEYQDIGILYGKSSIQMSLEKELRHRGIPYTVVESTSSTLDGIAYDIFNFLQLVVYPEDKLAFMSVINSPFARISAEGQSFLCGDAEGFRAFSSEVSFALDSDRIAYENLEALYNRVRGMVSRETLSSILEVLYYSSGYHTYIQSSGNLSAYSEHFEYLWSLANKLDDDGQGIVEALDFLRPIVGKAGKLENVSIGHLGTNGVKLMTVHKSKGLEFPIVILADAGGANKRESEAFINVETRNDSFISWDLSDSVSGEGEKLPYARIFNEWAEKRLSAERKRLLYVALTRAVNHLLVVAHEMSASTTETLYSIYKEAFDKALEDNAALSWSYRETEVPLIEKIYNIRSLVALQRKCDWYEEATIYPEPIWNAKKVAAKDASHVEIESSERGERLPLLPVDSITAKHKSFKTGFGSWVHQALEEKLSGSAALTEFECDGAIDKNDQEELLKEAKRIAEDFVSSEFYKENIGDNSVGTEIEFYYPDGDRVLQGSADLVVFRSDCNLVVDYKTDKFKTPLEHKGQITTYVKAMEDLYGKKCYGRLCYIRDFSSGPVWDKDGNEVEL